MNLSKVSTDQLREELKNRGYQMANLWCLDDVEMGIERLTQSEAFVLELSEEDKMLILEKALRSDTAMEAINDVIYDLLYEEIEGEAEETD